MAAWLEIEGVDVKDLPDVGMTVHVMFVRLLKHLRLI
jgi:hypothetical protein